MKLLELSIKENPENDRNMHYLGREYMYYGKWNKSIDTLIKHIHMKNATWKDERCASMRFIARCYQKLKRYDEANMYLEMAIKEAPYLRDPYVKKALKIKNHQKTYINETFSYDNTIYDLLAISTFYNAKYKESLKWINKAIKMESNKRLLNNKKIIEDFIKKNNIV